jgi:hypothetical protein
MGFGLLRYVGCSVSTSVSEEYNTSIFRVEDAGTMFLRNFGTQPELYTAQQSGSPQLFK